jgi:uncharacterized protein YqjF (DUF2071 family)
MFQSWRSLLFAHWPVEPDLLRSLVPSVLELDLFDGTAWIAITPFVVADLHARGLPPIPGLATFPEMNLRTYVRENGRPAIFFFSLDAANAAAVLAARTLYRLPYRRAEMVAETRPDGWTEYASRRIEEPAEFRGRYRPSGPAARPRRGSIEHFLTERYALATVLRDGRILRADIHHEPWRLQPAQATIAANTVAAASGIVLPGRPPLLHYAECQDTLIWPPVLATG